MSLPERVHQTNRDEQTRDIPQVLLQITHDDADGDRYHRQQDERGCYTKNDESASPHIPYWWLIVRGFAHWVSLDSND